MGALGLVEKYVLTGSPSRSLTPARWLAGWLVGWLVGLVWFGWVGLGWVGLVRLGSRIPASQVPWCLGCAFGCDLAVETCSKLAGWLLKAVILGVGWLVSLTGWPHQPCSNPRAAYLALLWWQLSSSRLVWDDC